MSDDKDETDACQLISPQGGNKALKTYRAVRNIRLQCFLLAATKAGHSLEHKSIGKRDQETGKWKRSEKSSVSRKALCKSQTDISTAGKTAEERALDKQKKIIAEDEKWKAMRAQTILGPNDGRGVPSR